MKILWVALSHCLYEQTPLKEIQAVNSPDTPLDSFKTTSAQKAELKNICQQIANACAAMAALDKEQ